MKNPLLAALLAFLIPGAGHLYQGRLFKAALYSVCILGTFLTGMSMAEWKAVYRSADPHKRNLGFYAQAATGLPAFYAFVQTQRYKSEENGPQKEIDENMSVPFTGIFMGERTASPRDQASEEVDSSEVDSPSQFRITGQRVTGRVELEPDRNQRGSPVKGTFRGTFENGEPAEFILGGGNFRLGRKVDGNPERSLESNVIERSEDGTEKTIGFIEGSIPRNFLDWFEAPMSERELQKLNGKLGKRYELALVYTWIAGLLNVLVIWDALEGPAYGYGDEEEESDEEEKKQPAANAEKQPEPAKS